MIKTDYWDIHAMADAIYSICAIRLFSGIYLKEEGKKVDENLGKGRFEIRALYERMC